MKKFFLILFLSGIFCSSVFCADLKAKTVVQQAQKKETVEESLSYIQSQIGNVSAASEKRALYIFMASLQESLAMYEDAKASYAGAAGIAAGDAEGMPKKSNEQLVLDAVRCALSGGDSATADTYLNSAVRNSKNETIQAYIKLYSQWSALCRAETVADLEEPIEILKAYTKVASMESVRLAVFLTLWYVTGENSYAKEITSRYPGSPEAAIVNGNIQLLPTPFWFFVPKLGEAQQEMGGIQVPEVSKTENVASSSGNKKQETAGTGGAAKTGAAVKLQLGLFRTESNAKYLVEELNKKGFDCKILEEKRSSGTTYYIVYTYENKDGTVADRLRSAGYECYIID